MRELDETTRELRGDWLWIGEWSECQMCRMSLSGGDQDEWRNEEKRGKWEEAGLSKGAAKNRLFNGTINIIMISFINLMRRYGLFPCILCIAVVVERVISPAPRSSYCPILASILLSSTDWSRCWAPATPPHPAPFCPLPLSVLLYSCFWLSFSPPSRLVVFTARRRNLCSFPLIFLSHIRIKRSPARSLAQTLDLMLRTSLILKRISSYRLVMFPQPRSTAASKSPRHPLDPSISTAACSIQRWIAYSPSSHSGLPISI